MQNARTRIAPVVPTLKTIGTAMLMGFVKAMDGCKASAQRMRLIRPDLYDAQKERRPEWYRCTKEHCSTSSTLNHTCMCVSTRDVEKAVEFERPQVTGVAHTAVSCKTVNTGIWYL